jgi:hypothetical protein
MWGKLEMKQQFQRVIMSATMMPPGWIKVGYTAKIGQDVAKMEEYRQKSIIKDLKDAITGVFKKKKEEDTPEEQGVLSEFIEEESVFAQWVPSWNILMPEGYQLFSQMPYLIEIEDIAKIDFDRNPFYNNKDKAKQSRSLSIDESGGENLRTATYNRTGSNSAGADDDETKIIRLYHVWDRRTNKRLVLSKESDQEHFEGDWSYDMHGFPYEPLYLNETLPSLDKSNPYPPNLIIPILPQVIEQSNLRSQMVKWRKRASAIIIAGPEANEGDMRQLTNSEAVQVIKLSDPTQFTMQQTPALPAQVFEVGDVIKEDLQMGTNMGQMMFAAQSGTRTATQANIGQSGLQLKTSAMVDKVEDFTKRVARKLCQLMWEFYDKEQIGELVGEGEITDEMWIPLPDDLRERRRLINSEIQFRIDAGSAAPPKDQTVDNKQLIDVVSVIANIMPERLNKEELGKQLIKRMKFDKMQKIIIGNDDEEKQAADEETQLMLKGAPQVVSPNQNHHIHIQEHQQAAGHPLVDKHILEHGKKLGIVPQGKGGGQGGNQSEQQGGGPQSGDVRPPKQSTNPEINRQGIPSAAGMAQSANNLGAGSTGKGMM